MCCERLLCASCSGRVVDARCGVCAASRARVHASAVPVVPEWLAVLVVAVVTGVLLLAVLLG